MADIWKAVSHSEGSGRVCSLGGGGLGGISIFSQKEKSQTSGSRHFTVKWLLSAKLPQVLCWWTEENWWERRRKIGGLGRNKRGGELEEREGMDGLGWGRNSSGCLHTAQKANSGPHTQKLRLLWEMWMRTVNHSFITWSLDPVLILLMFSVFHLLSVHSIAAWRNVPGSDLPRGYTAQTKEHWVIMVMVMVALVPCKWQCLVSMPSAIWTQSCCWNKASYDEEPMGKAHSRGLSMF